MSDFQKTPESTADRSDSAFKAVFFSRETIWLAPNELVRYQLRSQLIDRAGEPGLKPLLLTFNQLEDLLFDEMSPLEIDDLRRRFILCRLSSTLVPLLRPEEKNDGPTDWRILTDLAETLGDGFDRLKLAGLNWAQVAGLPPTDLAHAVAGLGREYDRILAEAGRQDRFGKRRRMLDLLSSGHRFAALEGVGRIVCRWSQRFSPFETEFLISLAVGRQIDICLNVPDWLFDKTIDHGSGFDLLRTIGRLERHSPPGLQLTFPDPDDSDAPPPLAYTATYLLAPPERRRPEPPPPDGRLTVIETLSAYHEVEDAARSMKSLVIAGLAPDRLALVVPDLGHYGPLIDDVGRRFGLAFHFRRGESLADRGPAQAALDLLALWSSNWERSRLVNLLRSPYFRFTDLPAADLGRLALTGGVTDDRAKGGFVENLGKIEAAIQTWLQANPDQTAASRKTPAKPGARRLAQTLIKLVKDLESAGQKLRTATKWPIFIKEFMKILNRFRWPGDLSAAPEIGPVNARGADLAAAFAFKEELGKLAQALASPQAPEVSLPTFSHWLTSVLDDKYLSYDRNADGRIRVLNYYDLHGGRFDEIFFLGLNERVFPKTDPEISWWPEQFTRAAADLLGRPLWNEAADRYQQEELMLALGLGQARERVRLYYHAGDEAGRESLPSPLLTAVMGLWPDGGGGSLIEKQTVPWTARPDLARSAGPDELWSALMNLEAAAWPLSLQTPENLAIHRDLRYRRSRWRQMKGLVAPGSAAMERWQRLRPTYQSPDNPLMRTSFLAVFDECPLKFWWGEALGLRPDDEPLEDWPARSEGTLAHRVLEKFFRARMPAEWPGRTDTTEAGTLMRKITAEEAEIWARHSPLGRKPLWDIRAAGLNRALEGWLARELESAGPDWRPMELEWDFQGIGLLEAPPWELKLDESHSIFFHGRVDRIDEAGGRLAVRDYKLRPGTGFRLDLKNKIIPQRLWPLLTYALAASSFFQKPVDSFLEIIDPAFKKGRIPGLASDDPAMAADLAARRRAEAAGELNFPEILADTWRAIKEGRFPSKEEISAECRWCPFTLMCPVFNNQAGGE